MCIVKKFQKICQPEFKKKRRGGGVGGNFYRHFIGFVDKRNLNHRLRTSTIIYGYLLSWDKTIAGRYMILYVNEQNQNKIKQKLL